MFSKWQLHVCESVDPPYSSHQDLLGKAQDPNCFFSQFSDSDFSGFTALTAASFLGNRQLVELLCQARGFGLIGPDGFEVKFGVEALGHFGGPLLG